MLLLLLLLEKRFGYGRRLEQLGLRLNATGAFAVWAASLQTLNPIYTLNFQT